MGSNLYDVSCPSTTFCAATEFVNPLVTTPAAVYFFDSSSWTLATSLMDTGGYLQIWCTSSDFCMAMDGAGDADTYSHGGWSGPVSAIHGVWPARTGLRQPPLLCRAWRLRGGRHLERSGVERGGYLGHPQNTVVGISCPSRTFCLMTQSQGFTGLDYYRTWSPGPTSV